MQILASFVLVIFPPCVLLSCFHVYPLLLSMFFSEPFWFCIRILSASWGMVGLCAKKVVRYHLRFFLWGQGQRHLKLHLIVYNERVICWLWNVTAPILNSHDCANALLVTLMMRPITQLFCSFTVLPKYCSCPVVPTALSRSLSVERSWRSISFGRLFSCIKA